jgi:hypothetical protein
VTRIEVIILLATCMPLANRLAALGVVIPLMEADTAALSGLQAAGMKLDLETDPWLQSYSYKRLDDDGEIIFSML